MIRRPEKEDLMFVSAMRVFRRLPAAAVAAVALVALLSCYPGDQLTVEEADVVVTLFDHQTDFGTLQSYAMPDTIVHLAEDADVTVRRDFDDEVLAQVAAEMAAMGFTRESDPTNSDSFMLISVATREQVGYTGYPWSGYWGWYYPYPPAWGWGWYPWYGGGGTIYTYRTGTVFMQLLDPAQADSIAQKTPTVWVGAINGMIEGTAIEERIADGIRQAFAQSPYLAEGK
ncbi:MAG TPA: DUF4136 domain-containing protein [Candidatus Krumholzibacteria bacterium]|nr:DUF4136 domain-containing protein [Candidatus Krumholzibacteria bacterium]